MGGHRENNVVMVMMQLMIEFDYNNNLIYKILVSRCLKLNSSKTAGPICMKFCDAHRVGLRIGQHLFLILLNDKGDPPYQF